MKTAIKHENYEFLVINLKHVTGLTCLASPTGTLILWEITQNRHKHENDEFLVITLKHVLDLTSHANPLEPQNCGQ